MDRALLLVAVACYLAPLIARPGGRVRGLATRWWVPAGVLLHVQGLALVIHTQGWTFRSVTETFGVTALLMILARLWFRRRPRMAMLRRILLGLACGLLAIAAFAPATVGAPEAPSAFFVVHIGLVLTGFAACALTFSMSTLYLVVRRRLKRKRLAQINRLPSLDSLDTLILETMGFGFATVSAGIAVGMAWSVHRTGRLMPGDLTSGLTLVVWAWYLAGLAARVVLGWRGRVIALFGISGFLVFCLVAVLGMAVFGLHGGGA